MWLWHRGVCVLCVQCRDGAADLCLSTGSAALFQDLLSDKSVTCGTAEWCVLQRIKKTAHTQTTPEVCRWEKPWLMKAAGRHHKLDTATNQKKKKRKEKGESDPFFFKGIIPHHESKQEMWHFCLKRSRISAASCLWLGTSDKTPLPCYYTLGVSSAKEN